MLLMLHLVLVLKPVLCLALYQKILIKKSVLTPLCLFYGIYTISKQSEYQSFFLTDFIRFKYITPSGGSVKLIE